MSQRSILDSDLIPRLHRFNRWKRGFDLCVILAFAPVVVPLMVLISLTLWVQQGRPILYSQERLGLNAQVFRIYKFRTMSDARDERGQLLSDSERITSVGRFLRKTSLDELPQVINVLRGDMAIIGPRPLFPRYYPYYTSRERLRHLVRPGVTGLAQVHGRNFVGWDERFSLDVSYVTRASLFGDLIIALKTIKRLLTRSDVAVIAGASGRPLDVVRTYPADEQFLMRALAVEDLPVRVTWMNDPTTRAHMRIDGQITLGSTVEWFESNIGKRGRHDFVIEDCSTQEIVAFTGLRACGPRKAESYIMVKPGLRGRGVGTTAQRFLLEWAFVSGLYDAVTSSVRRDNTASYHMHIKFGGHVTPGENGRYDIVVHRDDFMDSLAETAR